jgi:CheY-like chemotaxis protein
VNLPQQTQSLAGVRRDTVGAESGRILVVEDDPDISHLLQIQLRDQSFEVDVVNDGTEGLNRASAID